MRAFFFWAADVCVATKCNDSHQEWWVQIITYMYVMYQSIPSLSIPSSIIRGHWHYRGQGIIQMPHHGAAQVDKSPTQWNFLSIKSTGAYCSWQMPHPWNCQVVKSPTYAREDGGWGMGEWVAWNWLIHSNKYQPLVSVLLPVSATAPWKETS